MSAEFPIGPSDETQVPVNLKTEPVAITGALAALTNAVAGLGLLFGWWTWTPEQVGAIITTEGAVIAFVTLFVRRRVTPYP